MATGATLHTVTLHLSDIDRGVYQELELRMARHPSETTEFLITRLLAYCLEYTDGIAFSDGGVSSTDEPAVLVRDLTGRITAWIEVGAPRCRPRASRQQTRRAGRGVHPS
ncbi:YaeQ family protein [Nocardia fusca]|uniref:YaeQ family protein n=1 Tax=Nocardia fusca TaxID=941183 RepID=UPI000A696366